MRASAGLLYDMDVYLQRGDGMENTQGHRVVGALTGRSSRKQILMDTRRRPHVKSAGAS